MRSEPAGPRPIRRFSPRRLLLWLRWGTVAVLVAALALDLAFPPPLPGSDAGIATVVTARDGTPLRAFADAQGVWRYPATPESVSPLYLEALLNYEDRWFHRHPGVNPAALLRAAWQWLRSGGIVSGGSTLSMQVARILDGHDTRSLAGKLRQMARALQLEARLSKDQILQVYLERAPFGGTIEGVEAASWAYLGKPAARLSHAEAALLAVLPQAPSRLRPDRHPEAARAARDKVLARMRALGAWSALDVEDARIEPVVARSLQVPVHAALLAQRLRQQRPRASRIVTTLDADLQRALEERVTAYFAALPPRTSAALLVVDNATMEARAYVGSVAFGDRERLGHVDMVRAWRSPGSTLKPFLYGMALDDGLIHSESLLVDAPQDFGGYRPGNFGEAFNGPVGAATALRLSLNVPAVDLLDRVGPARFAARLNHAGVPLRFPRGARPGLPLILGGTGVRLEELVGAFAAFQRQGVAAQVRHTPEQPLVERRLLSPGAAWIVREILQANPRPGHAAAFATGTRPPVAWKTGTSYGFRDAWAVGGTRRHTVGVWVGRPDGTPLPGQYGAITALPLLFEVVDSLPRAPGDADPVPRPASVDRAEICWPLGLAAAQTPAALCQRRLDAWRLDGTTPPTFPERDARLWNAGRERFRVDAASGLRLSADCARPHQAREAEIARWPALLSPWLPAGVRRAATLPPLAPDCVADGREAMESLRIEGIADRATLAPPPGSPRGLRLRVRALGTSVRVQWLLDGRWIAQTEGARGFEYDYAAAGRGTHVLTALAESGAWAQVRFGVAHIGPRPGPASIGYVPGHVPVAAMEGTGEPARDRPAPAAR
ncbi:penicillin-binding protein 1C [Pseudoxanthomonas broegbernensis]|uniref:peptidoglycan glycosyltransferase n=1 Tax=Pseudoxanthomonas broegbernensis TaxID=83619 RepID=A0A7V8GQ31_9GAMM|nr:penicillin-binding protein 1C [Pseudoxanthomonas broegbernensis]KAF1688033.1 penicillin-binding protein 1C [Pseudoxanthomonas broegbernensis]MBB6065060.1 penicillin-binding protein 1C [Pseudoxanthomonas broegbernensis]